MKKKRLLVIFVAALFAIMLVGCGNAWRQEEPIIGTWKAVAFQSAGVDYTSEEFNKMLGTEFNCTVVINTDGSAEYTVTGLNTQYLDWDKEDKQENYDHAYWIGSAPATIDDDDLDTMILYMESSNEDEYVLYYMERQE